MYGLDEIENVPFTLHFCTSHSFIQTYIQNVFKIHFELNVGQVKFNNTHDMHFQICSKLILNQLIFNELPQKESIHQLTREQQVHMLLFINNKASAHLLETTNEVSSCNTQSQSENKARIMKMRLTSYIEQRLIRATERFGVVRKK